MRGLMKSINNQQTTTVNAQEELDAEYPQYITGTDSRNGAAPSTPLAPFQVRPVQSKLCYNGPNPLKTCEDRMAIWKWVKDNGLDHGLSFNEIHDAVNTYFFAGQAKPEWITDILSGRKTPLRKLAIKAWKAQYYRMQAVDQAKELVGVREKDSHSQLAAMADQLAAMDRLLMKDKIKKAILVAAILITIIFAVAGISFHYWH
jgi:hypothetical protein